MRRLIEYLREDWPRLAVEVIVLVVGVTLSLLLNEWRTTLDERRTERRYLEAVRDGLASDTVVLALQSRRLEGMMHAYDRLLDPRSPAALPADSVDAFMDLAITYVALTPNDNAYEEMRQTGQSRFIRDKALLNEIISLYNRDFFRAREWDGINRSFVLERMIPYVDENAPYVEGRSTGGVMSGMLPVYRALAAEDRFRNLLKTNRLFKEAHLAVYAATRTRVDSLIAKLDRELEER